MEQQWRISLQESQLASRRAEEAALRRFQAAAWLEALVGPLGLSDNPSESEFLSRLRNGLVLCNAINKIQPGSVPKVVENHSTSLPCNIQPLTAYQHFENVRNFLVAIEELKLPAFEASDLERETMEAGSSAKIVDCILALKCYHEWNQYGGTFGSWKYARSPIVSHMGSRTQCRGAFSTSSESCRRLDMSTISEKRPTTETDSQIPEDSMNLLAKALANCVFDSKENVDQELLNSLRYGNQDSLNSLTKIVTSCLQGQQLHTCAEPKSVLKESLVRGNSLRSNSLTTCKDKSSTISNKCCNSFLKKGDCNHWKLLEAQEKDLMEIKTLLSSAKNDFKTLEVQLQTDMAQLGNQVQELSAASLGYHRVIKENRELYNMLQDLKGNIRVFCRIRPVLRNDMRSTIDFIGDDGSLIIVDPLKLQKDSRKVFQFNKVFGPTATQEDVYMDTRPLIRSVMDGYNVCIFAYGQTGSGKTHTMCGPRRGSSKDMGINYLALNDLFQIACRRKDVMKYVVQIQMVEIYNEQVRDLLLEDATITKLEIRNSARNGGISLPDANMHPVESTSDVLEMMKLGEANRVVSSTAVNDRSSRSHSIVTVHVEGKDKSGSVLRSCLHLVDLAGSERVDKSEVTGDRLKEAQHINRSLSCLGDVIAALAQKNAHIPYRNSKLTQLLQDSLGGRAKALMFAHVSPEEDSYGETISTLKFAQRVSTVELGTAHINKESSKVRELKEQIESLKAALARKEGEESTSQLQKIKDLRSPPVKTKMKNELTPPRPRRLSIEPIDSDLGKNTSDCKRVSKTSGKSKVRMDHTPIRSSRSSLEGPKAGNDLQQVKKTDNSQEQFTSSMNGVILDKKIPCPSQGPLQAECDNADASEQHTPSPCPDTIQNQSVKLESRSRIPQLMTPEPSIFTKREVKSTMENELLSFRKSQPMNSSSITKKGSQIRKSLQTIGKIIHGSERRIHQLPVEILSPIHSGSETNTVNSPTIPTSMRVLRRQSLTGASGIDVSRRSSLGGKQKVSNSNGTRNARTPPPDHPSTMVTKRWMS